MIGGGTTSTTITWDADSQRVKMQRYDDYWEFIYDPTASTPAVLFAKSVVVDDATYMYYVREPSGALLAGFDLASPQNKFYYHFDGLGSMVLRTDGSGTVSDATTYGAWGADLVSSGSTKPYHYVGRLGYYTHCMDQRTGLEPLLQLGVRFYDPEIGRFTQRDPAQDGINLYTYVGSQPTRLQDPSGLWGLSWGLFTGWVGHLMIDSSCKGRGITVLSEEGTMPVSPSYGQWVDADGFIIDGQGWKIDGSTYAEIYCNSDGSWRMRYRVNILAAIFRHCRAPYRYDWTSGSKPGAPDEGSGGGGGYGGSYGLGFRIGPPPAV